MTQQVVNFLLSKFPKKWYSIKELEMDFNVSRDTIYYWIRKFEIPTFKVNNSPFIIRENLVNFLLKADRQNYSEDRLVGFEFILEDLKKVDQILKKAKRNIVE